MPGCAFHIYIDIYSYWTAALLFQDTEMFHRSGRSLQLVKFSENSNIGLCFKSLLDCRTDFFLKVRFVYKLKSQRLILTVVAHQSFHNASGEVKRSFLRWRIASII